MATKPSVRTAGPALSVLQERLLAQPLEDDRRCREAGIGRFGAPRVDRERSWQFGRGSDDDGFKILLGGLEGPLDVHPRPISSPRRSGRTRRQRQLQRACRARARPDVLADDAPLESRRRSTQGAPPPAAGRCRRPVPGKHAGHHVPVPVLVVAGSKISPLSPRHLNVVTVARLVQILGAQVTPACATRRAPYHRPVASRRLEEDKPKSSIRSIRFSRNAAYTSHVVHSHTGSRRTGLCEIQLSRVCWI